MATPSFDEFYSTVKARLPSASDELIRSTYRERFNADPVRTQGPTFEEFAARVRQSLPDAEESLIREAYDEQFGAPAGTSAKRAFKSGFAKGGEIVGGLLGGLGNLVRFAGSGGAPIPGVGDPASRIKALTETPAGGVGERLFNVSREVVANNAPAAALQGNVIDDPRLLANPAFYAQGLGGLLGSIANVPGYLLSGAQRGADLYNEGRLSGGKAAGLGAVESVLNVLPFGASSRLANAGLMGAATGGMPILEAAATGDDMGEALKQAATVAPFGMALGAALPARSRPPVTDAAGREAIMQRAREAAGQDPEATGESGFSLEQALGAAEAWRPPLRLSGPEGSIARPAPDFVAGADGVRRPGQAVPDPLALPAPRMANQFEVDPQGNAIQLTEAQADGAEAARRRPNPLGLGESERIGAAVRQRLGIDESVRKIRAAAEVPEAVRTALEQRYLNAARALPDYEKAVRAIGKEVGARDVLVAPLKGVERAVEKTMAENGGDVDRLRDLIRGTIVVDDITQATQAISAFKARFGKLTKERNTLVVPETRDGYRDVNINGIVNGQHVELQINVPEMIEAKAAMHALYEERRVLDALSDSATAEQLARSAEIDAQMKARYDAAWEAFKARRNSSSETSTPSLRSSPNDTGLPSGELPSNNLNLQPPSPVGSAAPGILPSTRKYTGSLPNAGSAIDSPPTAASIPDQGREFTTPTGRSYRARAELVELDDLVSSEREGYPAEVQPRQRDRASSQAQIDEMARGLRPDKLQIVVGPDNVVESGNGRTMALRRAAAAYPEQIERYKQFLRDQGYDTAGMRNPVLVQRRTTDLTPEQRAEFAREMNRDGKLAKGAAELALEDAAKLNAATLTQMQPGDVGSAANAGFVRAFMQTMSAPERGGMLDPDGRLSADGIRRISNAVMAKAYGGDRTGNAVLARALESADNEVRSVTGAMLDAAPRFAELRQAIADGQVPRELDIGGKIAQAVEQTAKLRAERKGLADYLAQEDAFNPHDPVVADLMRSFYRPDGKRAAGREQVAAALQGYADRALQQSLTQGDMLGGGAASAREIMATVLRDRPRESAAQQGRLIAEPAENYKRSPTAIQDKVREAAALIPDGPLPRAKIEAIKGELVRRVRALLDTVSKADDQKLWQDLYDLKGTVNQGSLRASKAALLDYAKTLEPTQARPTRAYAGKSVSSKDGQLAFDFGAFETRPDTTHAQVELGRAALSDLISERDRRAGASVLADGLTRDFTQTGTADLVGQTVQMPSDLAALAQVLRDPRFETLRFFFMKGDTIVDHAAITSRLPGAVGFKNPGNVEAQLRMRMRNSGADGYYLLHNHPAGKSKPSDADIGFTRAAAANLPGLRAHVVIDHNEFSTIFKDGSVTTQSIDFKGYDPVTNPRVPHPLVYSQISGPSSLMRLAKSMQLNKDMLTLITVDTKLRVKAIAEFPPHLLEGGRGEARIARMERGSGGGTYTFALGSSEALRSVNRLLDVGKLADSINLDGGTYSKGPVGMTNPLAGTTGSVVQSSRKNSRFVLDEPPQAYTADEPRTTLEPGEKNPLGGGEFKLMQFSGLTPGELVTLTQAVDGLSPAIEKQRRGTRGWDATEQAALKLIQQKYGITLDQLVHRRPGAAANAEQLEAYAQIISATTRNLTELAAEVRRTGSNDAKLALAAAKDKLGLLLAPAIGYQTEAGRALNILRKTAKDFKDAAVLFEALGDGSDRALTDFAERVGQATNPDQVLGVTRAAYTPTWWDKFYEYWINGLLSGPTTHAVNMVSNAMFQALDLAAEGVASVVSKDVSAKALRSRAIGMAHGVTLGLHNAKRALLTGEAQIGGQTQVEHPPAIGGKIGKVIRTPSRFLTAEDELFKSIAYQGELASIAMRRAIAENPPDIKQRFAEIMGDVLNDPAMRREARIAAERATFQTPLGPIGQAITMAINKSKVGRLIVPFIRTPTNILKRATEFTPAGYGADAVRQALSRGGRDAAVAHARIAIGSAVMLGMVGMAASGMVSGNGPEDPAERGLLMRQGWQPYSIRVGDRWYRYNRFDPIGMLMGFAADMHDIGAYASADELDKMGSAIMTSIALNLGDKTFLRGITEFSSAYSDPQRYLARWAQGMGASVIPNISAQGARGLDPYMRETQSLMDAIKAKVPGMRESLARKLDIAGQPVGQTWDVPGNPVQNSQVRPDALADAMLRLDVRKGKPAQRIAYKGRSAELTADEYESYAAFLQGARWRVLTPIVSSPQFQMLRQQNAEAAKRILEQQWDRIGDEARALWLFRNPGVITRLSAPQADVSGSQFADQASAR